MLNMLDMVNVAGQIGEFQLIVSSRRRRQDIYSC